MKITPFVHIVESLDSKDYFEDIKLGAALAESLKIINIPYSYKTTIKKTEFDNGLEPNFIREQIDLYDQSKYELFIPIIHFYLHGCEKSGEFCLASGEVIGWEDISQLLLNIKEEFSLLIFCTGSCYGAEAKKTLKIKKSLLESAFFIGNKKSVRYDDALVSYVVFYHNFLKRLAEVYVPEDALKDPEYTLEELKEKIKSCVKESFKVMAYASGDNNFEFNDGSLENLKIRSLGIKTMGSFSTH
jgi:hypothetical protein